jgi:hypothetical protein
VGCERPVERADKEVQKNIEAARAARGEGAITAGLQKAAANTAASSATSVQAKTLLAQAEVEQARIVLSDVDRTDLAIARLAAEITDIGEQVRTNNALIAGYLELSPKATGALGKLVEAERTKVQGKGDTDTWKIADVSELPAVSKVNAKIKALDPQIKELEDKKAGLAKQRTEADAKAADLMKQSKRKTGRPSVDLFVQSTNETKRSADLANQIVAIDHQLLSLRQDLALAQSQLAHLQDASKGFATRLSENKKSEQELQGLIQQHRQASQQLVYGEGGEPAPGTGGDKGDTATPPADQKPAESDKANPAAFQEKADATAADVSAPSAAAPSSRAVAPSATVTNATMALKAKEMAALLAETSSKRKAAADLLTQAISHYDGALTDAQKLVNDIKKNANDPNLRGVPQQTAWKAMQDIFGPAKLKLQKANVEQMLAAIHRDAASSISLRKSMLDVVQSALGEANITIPPELHEPKIEAELAQEGDAAKSAYDAADTHLQEVIDGGGAGPIEQQAAKDAQVAKVVLMHSRAQLERALNNDAGADKLLSQARQTVEQGEKENAGTFPSTVRLVLGLEKAPTPTTAPSGTTRPSAARPGRPSAAAPKPAPTPTTSATTTSAPTPVPATQPAATAPAPAQPTAAPAPTPAAADTPPPAPPVPQIGPPATSDENDGAVKPPPKPAK